MQIADESGWLQVVFGIVLTFLGGAWIHLQRQIGRLRSVTDRHTERIAENTQAIAVNSAIREETASRHREMMARFDKLESDLDGGLEKIAEKLAASESTLHTRINDLWKSKGKGVD